MSTSIRRIGRSTVAESIRANVSSAREEVDFLRWRYPAGEADDDRSRYDSSLRSEADPPSSREDDLPPPLAWRLDDEAVVGPDERERPPESSGETVAEHALIVITLTFYR